MDLQNEGVPETGMPMSLVTQKVIDSEEANENGLYTAGISRR